MAYKRGVPEPPTPEEAVAMANFFDEIGEVEAASLLDEYVVKCAAFDGDLKKQAGIFSTIWKRLKGKIKMFFYGEYKELFRRAKEAQEELEERLDDMQNINKEIKKHLKNHELFDWRNKVAELQNFYTKDVPKIMRDFDEGYSKIAAYLLGVKEQAEKKGLVPKSELEKVPQPSWVTESGEDPKDIEEEKVSEPGKPEVSAPEEGLKREKGWYTPDPRVSSVEKNDALGQVRVSKERFNKYLGRHIVEDDPENDVVKVIPHEGKYPVGFAKIFGKGTLWQVVLQDSKWVYLMKVEELTKIKGKEPEEAKPEEAKPEVPPPSEIPEPSLAPPPPEEAAKPEEAPKEEVTAEDILKSRRWVVYKPGSQYAGRIALVKQPKGIYHELITDEDFIKKLNEWFIRTYEGRRLRPVKPEDIREEVEVKPEAPEAPERTARMLRLISIMKQAKE